MTNQQLGSATAINARIDFLKRNIDKANFFYEIITGRDDNNRDDTTVRHVEMVDAFIEPDFIANYVKNMTDRVAELEKEFSEL